MFKKLGARVLALALVLILAGSDVSAQTRIRFARGKSSAVVSGSLAIDGTRTYVVNASAGQYIKVRVSSTSGNATVYVHDPSAGEGDYDSWEGTLTTTGDARITVFNDAKSPTRFTLSVSIK